jgi:hypothetical protein
MGPFDELGGADPNIPPPQTPDNTGGGGGSTFSPATAAVGMIGSGVATALGGVVDIFAGSAGIKRGEEALGVAEAELKKLKASQPSLSTPSEYYEAAKNAYDQRLVQMRTEDINRSLATTTQAAGQFGARGLGAVMQAQRDAQSQMRTEALTQQQLQTQALTNLADARQQEVARREARSTRDLEYGYDAQALAQAQVAQARQQRTAGFAGALGGAAQAGLGALALDKMGGFEALAAEKGAKVQKTPGEFNHDTNEMYVVDEDGKSVGIALTGGEYVIAPKDAAQLRNLSNKGKSGLHKFVRKLVNRFEKAD